MINSINTSMAMMHYNTNNSHVSKDTDLMSMEDKALKKQTDNFEAIMIKQMLDDTLQAKNSLFPKQAGADIYQSMYNDAMSKSVSGSFGFSQLLYDYLKESQQKSTI